jgi:hypothetical protein
MFVNIFRLETIKIFTRITFFLIMLLLFDFENLISPYSSLGDQIGFFEYNFFYALRVYEMK